MYLIIIILHQLDSVQLDKTETWWGMLLNADTQISLILFKMKMFSEELTKETFLYHPQPSLSVLYMLSDGATHEAVHLLCRMLVFDPVTQIFLLSVLIGVGGGVEQWWY